MSRGVVLAWLVASFTGCSDPAAPVSDLTETLTSEHYAFHLAPGDSVDTDWQEAFHAWLTAALEIKTSRRLEYFKYRNRSHLQALTGRRTNGFAEPGTVRFHTIWPVDNHEGVHTLVLLHFGHPPALFNEGVAVAHHVDPVKGDLVPRWNQRSVHGLARELITRDELPALAALVESPDFFSHLEDVTYPTAGSFVRYLLDQHGREPFQLLLAGAAFDDSAVETRQRFAASYGIDLEEAWGEWREWLEGTSHDPTSSPPTESPRRLDARRLPGG